MYCSLQHAIPELNNKTPQPTGKSERSAAHGGVEWPTWGLIVLIYGGWLLTVLHWRQLSPWLGTPLLIFFTCWYMSLQHELIHGHPTGHARLNEALGTAPLAIWYPYAVYRDTHLAHHHDERLTLPGVDPESYYLSPKPLSGWRLSLAQWRNTAPGRLLLGPLLGWLATLQAAWRGGRRHAGIWLAHFLLTAALLYAVRLAGIHPLYYVFVVAYPALALAMVRSFYEHRAVSHPAARSVINEAQLPWRVLFLNLNYHLVHHLHPGLPWYQLRARYLERREHYLQLCDGFHETGYLRLLWRHRAKPVIAEFHPFA